MRDVSRKPSSLCRAVASSSVRVATSPPGSWRPDPDSLAAARVAGMMAAKEASRLIPSRHAVRVDHVQVDVEPRDDALHITCSVTAVDRAGVELEALCGATVAALSLCDAFEGEPNALVIGETRLLESSGDPGAKASERPLRAAVLVVSDSAAAGERQDRSGRAIVDRLRASGVAAADELVLPDDPERVEAELRRLVAARTDLVFTTGGTGLGPRDRTVEAAKRVFDREVPGIAEAMRLHGYLRTTRAMLSRSVAGVAGETLIVTLPGSTRGVLESLDAIWPALLHAFAMLRGGGHRPE